MPAPLRLLLVAVLVSVPLSARADNPVVRITTALGSFDVELCDAVSPLCPAAAPIAVANFLGYLDRGDYENTLFHRSIAAPFYTADFVIQGGGFYFDGNIIKARATQAPIANEFDPLNGNVRGTLAMAKFGADPDSATNQWFVNLNDNRGVPPNGLDYQNGGFTVFGVVAGDGMTVVDLISDVKPYNMIATQQLANLFALYVDPDSLVGNFQSMPLQKASLTTSDLPYLADYAVSMSVARVPEPAAPAGAACAALLALAACRRAG